MSKKLVIRDIKNDLPPIDLKREIDERLPQIPSIVLAIMKVRSGKSVFMANYLLSEQFMGGKDYIFDTIYIISPTAKIDRTSQIYTRDEFKNRIIIFDKPDQGGIESFLSDIMEYQSSFDIHAKEPEDRPPLICILFDDCSGVLKKSKVVAHFFSRYRHYGVGQILVCGQTVKDLPTIVRSQATAIILSSCYSVLERKKVIEEWADQYGENFEMCWDYACKERYNHFYLKLDDFEPRCFRIGKDPIEEIDYRNFHHQLEDEYMVDIGEGEAYSDELVPIEE